MENLRYTLPAYQKKPEFALAIILVNNFKNKVNKTASLIEKNSLLVIDGDSLKGNAKNVYDLLYK